MTTIPQEVLHTPGPWVAQEFLVSGSPTCSANVVCEFPQGCAVKSRVFWEANARLIAAAPDLLDALQNLVADILDYERINNLAPSPGKDDCWQSVTRARAAIAKATGGTP